MSLITYDLQQLYRRTFGGSPYQVGDESAVAELTPYLIESTNTKVSQLSGSPLVTEFMGKEIWLPVTFLNLPADVVAGGKLLLPYSVIKIAGKKTIVKTALSERRGTVKELFSIDDYSISIKGFLIDENRVWPEEELSVLKRLFETQEAVHLDNALTNIYLDKDTRVVIEDFDLPEVEGGRKHIRPFSMKLESDSIFTLELA
jgi:hypothetical protein